MVFREFQALLTPGIPSPSDMYAYEGQEAFVTLSKGGALFLFRHSSELNMISIKRWINSFR